MVDGTEIHAMLNPAYSPVIGLILLRKFVSQLIDRCGFVTTRARDEDGQDAFLRRVGFDETGHDGQFHYYMLSAKPLTPQRGKRIRSGKSYALATGVRV